MFAEFGQEAMAREASRARGVAQQRALLDAQVAERHKLAEAPAASPDDRSTAAARVGRRSLSTREAVTLAMPTPSVYMAAPGGGAARSFARAHSEITRGVSEEEAVKRARAREDFAAALEAQVKEKEAAKAAERERLRALDADDDMGYLKDHKSVLARARARREAAGGAASPDAAAGHAFPVVVHSAASALQSTMAEGPSPVLVPPAATTPVASSLPPINTASTDDKLNRILSLLPGAASPATPTEPLTQLAGLVQELLVEQRSLRQALSSGRAGGGTPPDAAAVSSGGKPPVARRGASSAPAKRKPPRAPAAAVDGDAASPSMQGSVIDSLARRRGHLVHAVSEPVESAPRGRVAAPSSAVARATSAGRERSASRSGKEKPAAFGRSDESKESAAARRARGEIRARVAAEERRLAVEAKKLERQAEKQELKAQLAVHLGIAPPPTEHAMPIGDRSPHAARVVISPMHAQEGSFPDVGWAREVGARSSAGHLQPHTAPRRRSQSSGRGDYRDSELHRGGEQWGDGDGMDDLMELQAESYLIPVGRDEAPPPSTAPAGRRGRAGGATGGGGKPAPAKAAAGRRAVKKATAAEPPMSGVPTPTSRRTRVATDALQRQDVDALDVLVTSARGADSFPYINPSPFSSGPRSAHGHSPQDVSDRAPVGLPLAAASPAPVRGKWAAHGAPVAAAAAAPASPLHSHFNAPDSGFVAPVASGRAGRANSGWRAGADGLPPTSARALPVVEEGHDDTRGSIYALLQAREGE